MKSFTLFLLAGTLLFAMPVLAQDATGTQAAPTARTGKQQCQHQQRNPDSEDQSGQEIARGRQYGTHRCRGQKILAVV